MVQRSDLTEVELAQRRLQAITGRPHAPVEARQAADELAEVLATATAAARSAGRGRWSPELARLDVIQVWLRRTRLDDLGVQLPTTVRVGNYAATGPQIAGMGGGAAELAELSVPRIGIDLAAVVDRQPPGRTVAAPSSHVLAA